MPDRFFAAVDMGTNSFHLIIVQLKDNGSFKVIDREREVIRLGSEYREKDLSRISPDEIQRSIETLNSFKKLAEHYNAPLMAVATSAVREAENKNEFIAETLKATGITVNVIDGIEEARLIYNGSRKALKLGKKDALCIDIGGGSTEIVYARKGNIIFSESLKLGSVRMSKSFFPDFVIDSTSISACEDYIENKLRYSSILDFNIRYDIAVGTSGSIQSTALLTRSLSGGSNKKSLNGYSFSREQLQEVCDLVFSKKTKEERALIPAMEAKRADIIPAGLLILRTITRLFNIQSLTISEYALREGVIVELIEKVLGKQNPSFSA